MQVWFGWGSDFPNPVHGVHYSMKKNMMLRERLHNALNLSPTQNTHVAIFVHCDCMLTYHLHDYKHLCRCIYEIWMCETAFFSLSSQWETLHSCLAGQFGGVTFCGNFRTCVMARSSSRFKISFHLFNFHLLLFGVTSSPQDQFWHPLPLRVSSNG